MQDQISIERLQLLHPNAKSGFQAFIDDIEATLGVTVRIVQGLRTFAEQDALYAQGRTTPGNKVTNAKGGQSYHCFGLAVDIVIMNDGQPDWKYDYSKIEHIFPKYGLTWGKAWNDTDHYEMSFGHGPSGWAYFLDLHNAGNVDDAGYVVFNVA